MTLEDTYSIFNNKQKLRLSFEFFPPKTEKGLGNLLSVADDIARYEPDFISVTYGAGGSTQDMTLQTLKALRERDIICAGHLTCVDATRQQVLDVARQYQDIGVNHIVALRGDPPAGVGEQFTPNKDGFAYSAELVESLRDIGINEISVAAFPETHPEAASADADIAYLKQKIDAGADRAITQYFFDPYLYLDFVKRARKIGITKPIIAGIMCINNFQQVVNFSKRCGASVPSWLKRIFAGGGSNEAISTAVSLEQIRILRENGVVDFHFYTLNRAEIIQNICSFIG